MAESNRITYHHEGAGSPSDNVARFLNAEKYSIGIGISTFDVRRSPNNSFTTTGQPKGRSLQVCFSGNRNLHPLRDEDLALARAAIGEARAHGWVTDNPDVYLHGDTASTACPGTNVKARRADLVAISKKTVPVVVVPPSPPPTVTIILLGADVTNFKWNGVLPADGRGFFDVPGVTEDRVTGITVTTRGYNDKSQQVPIFTTLEYGKNPARVLLWGGTPGIDYTVHVSHV